MDTSRARPQIFTHGCTKSRSTRAIRLSADLRRNVPERFPCSSRTRTETRRRIPLFTANRLGLNLLRTVQLHTMRSRRAHYALPKKKNKIFSPFTTLFPLFLPL